MIVNSRNGFLNENRLNEIRVIVGAVYGGGRALALKNKQSRKQLEKEVTSSMFTIRMAEIKADWFENK